MMHTYRDDHFDDIDPNEDAEDYYDTPSNTKNNNTLSAGGQRSSGTTKQRTVGFRDEIPEDEYGEEYDDYQTTGDVVPMTTRGGRNNRKYLGFGLVCFGVVLVFGGFSAAFLGGGGKNDEEGVQSPGSGPTMSSPFFDESPTPSPVKKNNEVPAITKDPEETGTEPPTHSSAFSILASLIGEDILLDSDSLANAAFTWLLDNKHLDRYDNTRIKQRFALVTLYLATNFEEKPWTTDDGWMTNDNECTWHGVTCQNDAVVALNLTTNGIQGIVPFEIALLSDTLLALKLSRNPIVNQGGELAWIGELTNLRLLEVDDSYLQYDGIPTYIKKLTDLRVLDVSNTLFYGELDGSIFKPLQKLLYLELGGNMYNSSLPQEISTLPDLEALYIYDTGLEGDLEFLSDVGPMYELWMDDNPYLVGTIPSEIGTLTTLASLSISNCDLWGQIPTEVGHLTLLEQIWLFGNWLSGTVPTEFGKLSELQILAIEDNNITDIVMPSEICDMDFFSVSADCNEEWGFTCDCCTCCEAPCPVANLPIYSRNPNRFLFSDYE